MVLPSYSFIFIFMPIVICLYFAFNSKHLYGLGKIVLLTASLVFYYSMGWKGFVVCILSILINYLMAKYLFSSNMPAFIAKLMLAVGVISNILALVYCKYLTYFELLANKYTGSNYTYVAFVVPVGISYFTFSQIAYLVDSYREKGCNSSFLDYALFVTFFPKITVGPIAFASEMIPQFNDTARKGIDYSNMSKGFTRFTFGMAKKLLIADNLAPIADFGYINTPSLGCVNAVIVTLSYTLQIYFDFSGYCDIAIGICQMLNLDLIDNFDSPYKSLSIAEFWKRWHISLTRFFRNYVYIPLGGNRKGKVRTYINTIIIFLISGLWHGAATTFVVWGLLHGIGSVISKIASPVTKKLPNAIRWLLTFAFVDLAWIVFRAPSLDAALAMYKELFMGGYKPIDINMIATCIPVEGQLIQWIVMNISPAITYYSGSVIVLFIIAFALYASTRMKNTSDRVNTFIAGGKIMAVTVVLFVWSVLSLSQVTEFIYVNF